MLRRWLPLVCALTACGPELALDGVWLNDEIPTVGPFQLHALVFEGSSYQQFQGAEWPLTKVADGTFRVVAGRLWLQPDGLEPSAARVLEHTTRVLDVDDSSSSTQHRLFVKGKACPLPNTGRAWHVWVSQTDAITPMAFDVSDGRPLMLIGGGLVEEPANRCGLLERPLAVDGDVTAMMRQPDGAIALVVTRPTGLFGLVVTPTGVSETRLAEHLPPLGASMARGADGAPRVAWLEPLAEAQTLIIASPADAWSTRRVLVPSLATALELNLATDELGTLWAVLAGSSPRRTLTTVALTPEQPGGLWVHDGVALRRPVLVRSDATLFGRSGSAWTRVGPDDSRLSLHPLGADAAVRLKSGLVVTALRRDEETVRLSEWTETVRVDTTFSVHQTGGPALPMFLGESTEGRLSLVLPPAWWVREPSAHPGDH